MNRTLTALALGGVAGLAFAGHAAAHTYDIGASCRAGLHVELAHYGGTDDIDVWVDGAHVVDTTFTGTYSLHFDFDQTAAHTWRVKVDGHGEKSPDLHGTVKACVAPPTTTEAPTTTAPSTTLPVEVTTTSVPSPPTSTGSTTTVEVGPPPTRPTLPATGASDTIAPVALALIAAGSALTIATRRRT